MAATSAAAAEVRQAILDGVGRIFDISPEGFDQQAPSAFGIFRWSIEKARESPGINLDDIIADLPEKQGDKRRVLRFLVEYHDKKKLYRKQVDLLLHSLMQSPSWRSAGMDGGHSELTAKLQSRIAVAGQATDLTAAFRQVGFFGSPGPPSTGGSTDDIVHQGLDALGDSETRSNWDADGQGLNVAEAGGSATSTQLDKLSIERFGAMEDQLRYLSSMSMDMQQELNTVRRSIDAVKTTVLGKIEVAIQEILECHDSHAKEHISIAERFERFEKTVSPRDHASGGPAPVPFDDCREAAASDPTANEANELGTILSQLESMAQSSRDSSSVEALSSKVDAMSHSNLDLQGRFNIEKALRDAELAALSARLHPWPQDGLRNFEVMLQDSLASERIARESFQQEIQQSLDTLEKKFVARDQAARDFTTFLSQRKAHNADAPGNSTDAEPASAAVGRPRDRSPVTPGITKRGPQRQSSPSHSPLTRQVTPPHSPEPLLREPDGIRSLSGGPPLRSPGIAERTSSLCSHIVGQPCPPVGSVLRQASQGNRRQYSPPTVNRTSALAPVLLESRSMQALSPTASAGSRGGSYNVPVARSGSLNVPVADVSSRNSYVTAMPVGESMQRGGVSPMQQTRTLASTRAFVTSIGQQDARYTIHGNYHVSSAVGGSGTYPPSASFAGQR